MDDKAAVLNALGSYLRGEMDGRRLARFIDDLIGDDLISDDEVRRLVDLFQNDLAYYVADEQTRLEQPGVYFSDEELVERVELFKLRLEGLE